MRTLVSAIGLMLALSGCDTGQKVDVPEKSKSLEERKQSAPTSKMSPEELAEARRKAGFLDEDELAKENIEEMKKGEREFVKTRLAEYRDLTKRVRELLDEVEKEAAKWPKAGDAQAAFDGFSEAYREKTKELGDLYEKLMTDATGIDVQAKVAGAWRSFENLNGDLGPEISAEEGFAKTLTDIRTALDEVEKEFSAIEADETLKINEEYKPDEEGGGDEGEG